LLVFVFLIRGAAVYTSTLSLAWVSSKVIMDLRNAMFEKLVSLPVSYFDTRASGNLISRLTFDAEQVSVATSHVLTTMIKDTLSIVGLLAWMFYLDWKLTLIVLIGAPVVVFTLRFFAGRLRKVSHSLQHSMGGMTHLINETIDGRKVVRMFGGQRYEQKRFNDATNYVRRNKMKFTAVAAANSPVAQMTIAVAFSVILYLAAVRSAADGVTVGAFVSFFAAMGMLLPPLKRVAAINGPLQQGIAGATSVFQIVDEDSEADTGTRVLKDVKGRIEFESTNFSYEAGAQPALHDITLTINPGETIALVGSSGSGKSTFVSLLPRFYAPTSGRILIDGIDVQTLTLTSLRHNIALVSQEIVLFNDTMRANIAYGPLANVSEAELNEAAEAAFAADFIKALPDGMETLIGENGMRLSGGQRQRLAIARAFLKDAPILILDEATSALDTVTEKQIQTAVERLRRDRTTIVIAHKLSTIERADRILVLDGGRLIGEGSHAELLKDNPTYAALYRFQFSDQLPEHQDPGVTNEKGS
jgi:subfamily B ATP-binding cassette protein MsbA